MRFPAMKRRRLLMIAAAMTAMVVALLCWTLFSQPDHPVALIRVVDAAGKPIQGAVVKPDGMRTKPGPYVSGHYGWQRSTNGPPAVETKTDANGETWVTYPQYVFEKIETGQISFSVAHPDFVPDRPFRVVATKPPAGAPWKVWANYLLDRVKHRVLISRTEPVVLQRGAIVKLKLAGRDAGTNELYAQISGAGGYREGFWTNPGPNLVQSRQVQPGSHLVRLVHLDPDGVPWFSEVVPVIATTNEATVHLEVKRGADLAGKLDPSIPRPIKRGRVIVHVTPSNLTWKDGPPEWHAWSETDEQGNFQFRSLPSGSLEISAICDGFISTNGPGQFSSRYPQRHEIGTNDISIVIGMEPTARLEVTILDQAGKPVPKAKVFTWPNIRYGEWASVIFASDCYNTADKLRTKGRVESRWGGAPVFDFEGESDANGVAVVPNVPASAREFALKHHAFELPAVDDGSGQKSREAAVKLVAGETNRVTVRVEPIGASQIAHY